MFRDRRGLFDTLSFGRYRRELLTLRFSALTVSPRHLQLRCVHQRVVVISPRLMSWVPCRRVSTNLIRRVRPPLQLRPDPCFHRQFSQSELFVGSVGEWREVLGTADQFGDLVVSEQRPKPVNIDTVFSEGVLLAKKTDLNRESA